jgi:hypothetical protein
LADAEYLSENRLQGQHVTLFAPTAHDLPGGDGAFLQFFGVKLLDGTVRFSQQSSAWFLLTSPPIAES